MKEKTKNLKEFYSQNNNEIILDHTGKIVKPINSMNLDENYMDFNFDEKSFKENIFTQFDIFHEFHYISKGKDIICNLEINLQDLINQIPQKINFIRYERCPKCNGLKVSNGDTKNLVNCYECRGTGISIDVNKYSNKPEIFESKCEKCNGLGFLSASPCSYFSLKFTKILGIVTVSD